MHPAFQHVDHRPWPLPTTPWTWRQTWCDLLFAHWPVPTEVIRPLVPAALEIDEHEGTTWVGVVPFRMEGISRRPLPDLPGVNAFPELNVRLYVAHEGKPGVWFLSLDAPNRIAVFVARRLFHLPYVHSRMQVETDEGAVAYRSERPGAVFRARYQPTSDPYAAQPGSLEHFLTERYCLYAADGRGQIYRGDVHHPPWPLQTAEAEIEQNDMLKVHGLEVADAPALLNFSRRLGVVVWSTVRVTE